MSESQTSQSTDNKLRKFKAGEVLFKEGEPGYKIYIIKEGEIRISTQRDDKVVTLGILKKGACFGEMAVISSAPRVASAIAETNTEVFEIDKTHVDKMIETLSPLFRAIINSLIKRVATLNDFATEKSSLGHPLSSLAHLIILLVNDKKTTSTESTPNQSQQPQSPSWARQPDPEPSDIPSDSDYVQVPLSLITETSQSILGFTKGNTQRLLHQFSKFNLAVVTQRGSQDVLTFNPKTFVHDTDKTLSALGHMIDTELSADVEYIDLVEMAEKMDTKPRYLVDAIASGRLPPEAIVLKQSLVRRAIEEYGRMFF